MDTPPASPLGKLTSPVYIDELVCDQVNMQAVLFVQLEDPKALQRRPASQQQRQQMVPSLPRLSNT
jgi:hypothetical protein